MSEFSLHDNFLNLGDLPDPTDRPTGTLFNILYLLNHAIDLQMVFSI